ncbi:tRNA-2-methylthio-N(6)-dimethylallyladenosine synthase [Frankliniella fusca]|uniref:tRNA-2-methylthio-N(6)-dimethylallyladenosine synthase n=1 Tax=Frankliniella fusca TaxID=407009 RepID=A0AAE1HG32_9NEOP|nr:tRNA-2-methylthio-N(6)-dimethylallyladenosine synthase [Frankliniella fusca]
MPYLAVRNGDSKISIFTVIFILQCDDDFVTRFTSRQKVCSSDVCVRKKNFRPMSYDFYQDYRKYASDQTASALVPGALLCLKCRILRQQRLSNERKRRSDLAKAGAYVEPEDPGSPSVSDSDEEDVSTAGTTSESASQSQGNIDTSFPTPPEVSRERLNQALTVYNLSPADPKTLSRCKSYATAKTTGLQSAITETILKAGTSKDVVVNEQTEDFSTMLNHLLDQRFFTLGHFGVASLKRLRTAVLDKFRETKSLADKFMILSVLPKDWTIQKVVDKFQCSKHSARLVKLKVKTDGILCGPNPKPGKRLSERTADQIIHFYEEHQYSRAMPGKRDYKTLKINGARQQVQKRLLLLSVRELYALFQEKNSEVKVSLSKFAELRPPYIILPGAAGTHSVCVCTIHQNVKLMMHGAKLEGGAQDIAGVESYKDCFSLMLCESRSDECYFGTCKKCPGVQELQEKLELIFDLNMVETVEYREWVSVDRTNLVTITQEVEEYIELFLTRLQDLAKHDFIARMQAAFLAEQKNTLEDGEVFVVGDFSMNYKPFADLTDFVNNKLGKITAVLVPESEIQDHFGNKLKERFQNAQQQVKGISSYHTLIPVSQNAVIVKRYSTSPNHERIQLSPEVPSSVQDLEGGFATVLHDVRTRYEMPIPEEHEMLNIHLDNILLLCSPAFDGITYGLSNMQKKLTVEMFHIKIPRIPMSPVFTSQARKRRRIQSKK